jgi:hypothetical protein
MDDEQPRFFTNDSGEILKRKLALSTYDGIMILRGEHDRWCLDFPDDTKTSARTIEVVNLIYFLKQTNGNLDKSKQWVGLK